MKDTESLSHFRLEEVLILILCLLIVVSTLWMWSENGTLRQLQHNVTQKVYDAGFRTPDELKRCYNITIVSDRFECLGFQEKRNGTLS